MVKKSTVYNFFKFLEDKRGEKVPFVSKLILNPESISEEELNIEGDLFLTDKPIKKLPNNLNIEGYLVMDRTKIKRLPDDIKVGGINATYSELEYLPNNLHTTDVICNNSKLQDIPYNLRIDGNFIIQNTPLAEKYKLHEIQNIIYYRGGYVNGYIYGPEIW